MAESEFQEGNYDGREQKGKLKKDLEELLEKIENVTVRVTCLLFDYTTISTNPDLINNTQHLQDAFLRCKEHIEKKGQEVLME
ncbi:SYCE3 protein, partial [Rhipidura dahli]|nr:SYCE3 protein [Rhipidura dahli]